jgi:hypothetical protein
MNPLVTISPVLASTGSGVHHPPPAEIELEPSTLLMAA